MKLAFTLTLNLLLATTLFAQTYISQAKPFNKKEWGYINQKGEFTIEPKYRTCYKFSDGYAPIYEGKKFFFINPNGEKLATDVNDFKLFNVFGIGMQGFSEGLVPVIVGKNLGYLNTEGKLAVPLKYEKGTSFNNGVAVTRKNDNFYIVNKNGDEIAVSDAIDVKGFSEGLAPYRAKDKKFGFIGQDGSVVISAQFLSVGYFSDGIAWAKTMDKKVGFITKKGDWLIEPKYLAAKDFDPTSGLAMVKDGENWVYTDKSGKTLTVLAERIHSFKNGLARGVKNGRTGYFNKEGKWVVVAKFDGGRDFKNGFAAVKSGDKWGFINESGEWAVEPQFGGVKDMELVK